MPWWSVSERRPMGFARRFRTLGSTGSLLESPRAACHRLHAAEHGVTILAGLDRELVV